jgi:hypothetical protein
MSLPQKSIDNFIETVHDKTKHFVKIVDGSIKNKSFTNDELRTLQKHLPEISFAFPCDNSISAVVTQVADALRESHYEVLCKGVVDELAKMTKIWKVWAMDSSIRQRPRRRDLYTLESHWKTASAVASPPSRT